MRSCILSIGSELLEGSVVDTNSAFIGSSPLWHCTRYDTHG